MNNFQVEDYHTYYVGEGSVLVHNDCPESGSNAQGNGVPVKEKTTASNGLDYQSNPKHSPGQPGNRPNAGVEPRNSLDLFDKSVSSKSKPNQRFTFDTETNTVHRFYNFATVFYSFVSMENFFQKILLLQLLTMKYNS